MKFIGQYIQGFIARFRNDVYLEDIDTGTIASGAHLGLDSNNKIVKAADGGGDLTSIVAGTGLSGTSLTGPIPTLNVDASQTQITAVGTLTALTVDEITIDGDTITASDDLNIVADGNDITIDTDTFTIESATTSRPFFKLKGVGNNANPSQMWIIKDKGAVGADGDEIGRIYFVGDDSVQTQTGFGEIKCTVEEADHLNEAGKLELRVANDGTLRNVITGTGIAATAAEVDVTIANGAASVTTIAGTLTMGSTAAMTNAGLLSVANQTGITGVGTISSGVWNGTAIATDQQKHLANFEFEGFSVGDGTNYMIAELNSDTKAPFEHQTSTGSDGLTATAPIRLLKTAGHVMPYAGTLKLWKGWATSSGSSQTVDVGLYKVTLVNNDADDVSPVVLKNTSFTSVGNTKALTFEETSFGVRFAAGDILISAVRNGTNNKRCDFASTLVVEWD